MRKTSHKVFQQKINTVFFVIAAVLALSCTYRLAIARAEHRSALRAQTEHKVARAAFVARMQVASRAGAKRHPASVPNRGYVSGGQTRASLIETRLAAARSHRAKS